VSNLSVSLLLAERVIPTASRILRWRSPSWVGFDLCPRLAKLKRRKLYVPRGLDVPEVLRPCVAETVSRRAIARSWEGLLRLAASVKHGWYPATEALDRFGSAAAGDPVYEAGDALGKLLRTLYLCDYFGNPAFRLEILDLLNQGEAVHSLQRAVYNGGSPLSMGARWRSSARSPEP
jgi:TnpA family transposase